MMYDEAIEHVYAGRAVYSATYGATLIETPRDKLVVAVPRATTAGPVRKIQPFTVCHVSLDAMDWELSGVVLPPPKAAA